ncbi:hypothetical protein [Streptomyces sp. NRRL S-87]|uniref:hypothetical protein n=1 Tax=Streptomyces sp. NRRL S-87 TaxID=1463920 RepID=UPI000B1336DB|nr:hypothetical protein [Streptomyces sp. NRRL S-87]
MTSRTGGMRRRIGLLAGATAMLALGGGLAATPAAAGPNCASGNHCVFWGTIQSARHSYFNGDHDFSNDTFDEYNVNGAGLNQTVNNNVASASNSSNSNYESHYWDTYGGTFLWCLNPGHYVDSGSTVDQPGTQNGDPLPTALRDRASALTLPGRTSTDCY